MRKDLTVRVRYENQRTTRRARDTDSKEKRDVLGLLAQFFFISTPACFSFRAVASASHSPTSPSTPRHKSSVILLQETENRYLTLTKTKNQICGEKLFFNQGEVVALEYILYTNPESEIFDMGEGTVTIKKIDTNYVISKHSPTGTNALSIPCSCEAALIIILRAAQTVLRRPLSAATAARVPQEAEAAQNQSMRE